ncbi:MAG: TatD family hydrolase [Planctomycetota bacterium]
MSADVVRVNHDAHCHVADYADAAGVLQACDRDGVEVVCVTVHPEQYEALAAAGFAANSLAVRVVPGLHPQELPAAESQLPRLLEIIEPSAWVGEIGLDGVDPSRETQASQRRVLYAVLDACASRGQLDKRLTLHSRRTAGDLLDLLDGGFPNAVLHWFSGDGSSLERAMGERRWFSVNPAMAGSRAGRFILKALPRDRVVYESDGPYAMCDGRPARPSDAGAVVRALASLWEIGEANVAEMLNANWAALNGEA